MARAGDIADVCVIGTGAGGGVWIDACTKAGLRVVALERGPHLGPEDFLEHDELGNTHRGLGFAPKWRETLRERDDAVAEPARTTMLAQCVGGGTAHWGAWSWRYREDDFAPLTRQGPIAGASLADWPVGYAELAPWYAAAERRLGVSGKAGSNPSEPPRDGGYPNPPHTPRRASLALTRGAKALGLHPFPIPMAINSRPYAGRAACIHGGMCANYGCPVAAKASTLSIHVADALDTGRLDLRADARVTELLAAKDGRVRAARYVDAEGREREVRARHFVVAGGAIGSAHLLLSSRSARHPDGLGNDSGLVGRNLMFHIFAYVGFELPEPSTGAFGSAGMVAIDDAHASDPARGFVGGAVVGEGAEPGPIWAAYKAPQYLGVEHGAWGKPLKDYLRRYPFFGGLIAIGEDLPRHENRVDLDPTHTDEHGVPLPRITHASHPNDRALHDWYDAHLHEIAGASGAVRTWSFDMSRSKGGTGHIMGTCRMGDDPKRSVLDRWCRSHEVPNLYVPDASAFPTSAGYNPTLTIFANAARCADHFLERLRRQDTT